jgi:hypothetical protein
VPDSELIDRELVQKDEDATMRRERIAAKLGRSL